MSKFQFCPIFNFVQFFNFDFSFQDQYTAEDLFDAVYKRKIVDDFETGKIDAETGNYKDPQTEELNAEEAWIKARQTGSDIFQGGVEPSKEWSVKWERK